ncbi:hypothetical protein HDU91_006909 [Kappamyces sp. JEL0680]|nr:hypothetical protein HDU91_006909 [Kappamyces sp. JEL0680]
MSPSGTSSGLMNAVSRWVGGPALNVEHADSNYKSFVGLFQKLGVSKENIHTINPALVNAPHEAADDYESVMKQVLGPSLVLDVILLGMETKPVAAILDSPKPPASRITLTFPVVNAARYCVFVATGQGKAEVLHRLVDGGEMFPAGMVNNTQHGGKLYWFVDGPAAKDLIAVPAITFKL